MVITKKTMRLHTDIEELLTLGCFYDLSLLMEMVSQLTKGDETKNHYSVSTINAYFRLI